jgi:hypothetical protein
MAGGIRLNSLRADVKKENDGDWVDVDELPGVRLKVRGLNYGPYMTALSIINAANWRRFLSKGKNVPFELAFKNNAKLFLDHLLLDWEGIVDDDGKPIPITEADDLLNDQAYRVLHTYIQTAAASIGEVEAEYVEESVGNSHRSSSGSSKVAAE